jgi:adenylate kinase
VLKFEVSDSTAMKRLAGRQTCSVCGAIYNLYRRPPREKDVCDACGGPLFQRADDKEEVILRRLEVYRRRTQPIEQHYAHQGKLKTVDAEASPYAVLEEILKTVGAG